MRRYLVMLAILVIVVFGAGITLVPGFRGKVFGVVKQGQGLLTGMTPAKTPDEAWIAAFLGEGFDPVDGASRARTLARGADSVFASVREGDVAIGAGVASGAV